MGHFFMLSETDGLDSIPRIAQRCRDLMKPIGFGYVQLSRGDGLKVHFQDSKPRITDIKKCPQFERYVAPRKLNISIDGLCFLKW